MFKTKALLKYSFILNFIFLTLHEMDAIFWNEWRLFGFTDDVVGKQIFIIAHLPLFFIIILGIVKLETKFGKFTSLIFSSFLIFHFFLHYSALVEKYFNNAFSFGIISCILLLSLIQLISTIVTFKKK